MSRSSSRSRTRLSAAWRSSPSCGGRGGGSSRPRRVELQPDDGAGRLTFPRPAGADRIEYLLEFTYRTGRVSVAADLTNPLRAPRPFGNKSVIGFPGSHPPGGGP